MYGSSEFPSLCDVEALLYRKEAQLDKFFQEIAMSTIVSNLAYINQIQEAGSSIGAYLDSHIRDNMFTCGPCRGRGRYTTGNHPTCQICGKCGHFATDWWHHFDESFMPINTTTTQPGSANNSTSKQDNSLDVPQ